MTKKWTIVVPFGRATQSAHVAWMVLHQSLPPAQVIIAGNGKGIGGLAALDRKLLTDKGIRVDELKIPVSHQSIAKNRGIEHALGTGAEWITIFDDDDHYLSGWLARVDECSAERRIVGARPHHVVDDGGLFRVVYDPAEGVVDWVNGGTISCSAETASRFSYPVTDHGEDVLYCLLAKTRDVETYDVGPGEFVYDRRGIDHAWVQDARTHYTHFSPVDSLDLSLETMMNRGGTSGPKEIQP